MGIVGGRRGDAGRAGPRRARGRGLRAPLLLLGAVFLAADPTVAAALSFDALVSFGDSLSDVGNGSLEPPDYGGRASNGPLWHEYLAGHLGLADEATRNYAIGGATSGTGGVQGEGLGLRVQAQDYAAAPPSLGTRPLFTVWAGGNDALAAVFQGRPLDPEALGATAAANIARAIQTLASAGARDFLVPNLPDAGLFPIAQDIGLAAQGSAFSAALNAGLETELASLDPALNVMRLDAFGLFETIVADPDAFGLSVLDEGCSVVLGDLPPCENPEAHLFWDAVHPTTGVHALLAERAFERVPEAGPGLLLAAAGAAAGIAATRRRCGEARR